MAKVSVLIPVCNVEKYLEQCLDSVTGQSMEDIEIICVDDGSTDGSGAVLDRYAVTDRRIQVIHKKNTGYGNTMNVALDHAEGEYIAIIESDDFAEPDMLQRLYRAAADHDAEVVKSNHYIYQNGKDWLCDWLKDYPKNRIINASVCPQILNLADTIWTCLMRRDFLVEHNIRFHETPGASFQDISFALQVWMNVERAYFISDAVLHYRKDNPGSSMHNPDKIFCVFEEYGWLEEIFSGVWEHKPEIEKYFVATKYRDYFSHYGRVAVQYQYALLLRLSESLEADVRSGRVVERAFSGPVWEQICSVQKDRNGFFRKTAKDMQDMRVKFCEFDNMKLYGRAFAEYMKMFPQVVVYGAGKVGQKLAAALKKYEVANICFAVTKMSPEMAEWEGIPVCELQETAGLAETCAIIIAVAERSQYELYQNLLQYNFRHVFRVDEAVWKIME
ncbi:MAG: glycosyltransferase [Lachnospiraceae bacterium]|nr:glycosyltransferase [Lachnospiraceae bacterium]